jgi:hypothetical protein
VPALAKPISSQLSQLLNIRKRYPLVLFLFFYFLFALFTYRDYGVAWDEYDVYSRGAALFQHLFGSGLKSDLFLHNDGKADGWVLYDYWYPMVLFLSNRAFSFEYFHWLNFFFASLAFIALFELLLFQTQKPWAAFLGPLFLFSMPRFLGHLPIAPRDASFAVFYLVALAALFWLKKKPGVWSVLVLGIIFGMAQSLRLVGLSLYLIWIFLFFYEKHLEGNKTGKGTVFSALRDLFAPLLSVFALSLFFMAATWPYLGGNFPVRFFELLHASMAFPWKGDFLFLGRLVSPENLPWHYSLVWILISTPLYALFFLFGVPFLGRNILKNRLMVFGLIAMGVNLGIVLALRPVMYLGMRHFLYLLPLMALLGSLCAVEFWNRFGKKPWAKAVAGGVVLNLVLVGLQLFRLHPYEYIYFNEFVGGLTGAYGKFEIEDRAISSKEAVQWLAQHEWRDADKTYRVTCYQDPFQVIYYLPPNVKYENSMEKADYLITLPFSGQHRFKNERIYSVEREGVPLMDIYKK